ncbi:HET-domain-containing protein [Ophiobolus disseminans]|uniref:HET-domain-containing protein n=1 Tax=Ophiobolus disseminans TaxID=1469910 RepID=A0A6A7A491_9PLEO|nr:HET-domain-containing protein [Ophiobolus disseminans]
MASTEEYSYRSLESATTIRVLNLHPGGKDDPLIGELVHEDEATLKSRIVKDHRGFPKVDESVFRYQPYEALSYVWGPPAFCCPIALESGTLLLTKSLAAALRRLRYTDRVRRIWADAACINQRDVSERSAQVKLMGRIYERAKMVVIWLGPDPDNEAAEAFSTHREHPEDDEKFSRVLDARMRKILNLDWFKRTWVIQEAVIATRGTILWGLEEVDYGEFQHRVQMYNLRSTHTDSMWVGEMRYYLGLWEIMHVLDWTRGLQCTDDRDRIYAVLGLPYVSRWNPDALTVVKSIVPDYTKSVAEVYTDFASKCVERNLLHKLWMLVSHGATWDPADTDIPSWVPDLSQPPLLFNSTRNLQRDGLPEHSGKIAELKPVLGESKCTVIVKGYVIGTITHVSEHCVGGDTLPQSLRSIAEFWSQHIKPPDNGRSWFWNYIRSRQPPVVDPEAQLQDYEFIKCLVSCAVPRKAGWEGSGSFASLFGDPSNYKYEWERHGSLTRLLTGPLDYDDERALTANARQMVKSLNTSFSALRKPPKPTDPSKLRPFDTTHRRVQPVWKCHKLYTKSGGRFGLGPMVICQGDVVALVGGSKYPIVLRPCGGLWLFVGNTYVSGTNEWEVDGM